VAEYVQNEYHKKFVYEKWVNIDTYWGSEEKMPYKELIV